MEQAPATDPAAQQPTIARSWAPPGPAPVPNQAVAVPGKVGTPTGQAGTGGSMAAVQVPALPLDKLQGGQQGLERGQPMQVIAQAAVAEPTAEGPVPQVPLALPPAAGALTAASPARAQAAQLAIPHVVIRLHTLRGLGSALTAAQGGPAAGSATTPAGGSVGSHAPTTTTTPQAHVGVTPASAGTEATASTHGSGALRSPAQQGSMRHALRRLSGQSGALDMDLAMATAPVEVTACGISPAIRVRCTFYDKSAFSDAIRLEHPYHGRQSLGLEARLPVPQYLYQALKLPGWTPPQAKGTAAGQGVQQQGNSAAQASGQSTIESDAGVQVLPTESAPWTRLLDSASPGPAQTQYGTPRQMPSAAVAQAQHSAMAPGTYGPIWPLMYVQIISARLSEVADQAEPADANGRPHTGERMASITDRETGTVDDSAAGMPREASRSQPPGHRGFAETAAAALRLRGVRHGPGGDHHLSSSRTSSDHTGRKLLSTRGRGRESARPCTPCSAPRVLAACSVDISRLCDGHVAHPSLKLDGAGGDLEATIVVAPHA